VNVEFEMVLHVEHGGFSLTDEIVRRLRERGCPWTEKLGKASPDGQWYVMADDDEFRRDPDLVAVVKELQGELESRLENLESWRERAALEQEMLHGLKVTRVRVTVEVDDHDGMEFVHVYGGVA
jgi:hypothetical protein